MAIKVIFLLFVTVLLVSTMVSSQDDDGIDDLKAKKPSPTKPKPSPKAPKSPSSKGPKSPPKSLPKSPKSPAKPGKSPPGAPPSADDDPYSDDLPEDEPVTPPLSVSKVSSHEDKKIMGPKNKYSGSSSDGERPTNGSQS
ncbi:vegetative cell wall protein gp1-like [Pyrus communis]|uniref:vegetative cell wall protein gp1-like n=1 Tax=Pyrus communis TaxID=23211 RepID=UPI0035C1B439